LAVGNVLLGVVNETTEAKGGIFPGIAVKKVLLGRAPNVLNEIINTSMWQNYHRIANF
jgi:hypothetical protein